MKSLFVASLVLAFLLLSTFIHAQDLPQNLYGFGASYNGNASPEVAGTALYAHQLNADTGTFAFSVFDAFPESIKPFSVNTAVGVGVAQKVFSIGKFPIYVPTSAGIAWKGSNVGWKYDFGALVPIKVYDNWRVLLAVRGVKSSVSDGAGIQPIASVLVAWGK